MSDEIPANLTGRFIATRNPNNPNNLYHRNKLEVILEGDFFLAGCCPIPSMWAVTYDSEDEARNDGRIRCRSSRCFGDVR